MKDTVRKLLPKSIEDNPDLDQWVRFDCVAGIVQVRSGKVEIGQGVVTAIAQMAAHELYLSMAAVVIVSGDTSRSPNEGITSASRSIEIGGASMRLACADARAVLVAAAAQRLGATIEDIAIDEGRFLVRGAPSGLSYWDVAPDCVFTRPIRADAPLRPVDASGSIGRSIPRLDLHAKLTVGAFVQDLEMPGMLHARVVRAPRLGARLATFDSSAAARAVPDSTIVRTASFLAVVASTEEGALAACAALAKTAVWEGGERPPPRGKVADWLVRRHTRDEIIQVTGDAIAGDLRHRGRYSRPLLAHASIGLSCGIAWLQQGQLRIWTHSQGVFGLREAVARVLEFPLSAVTVTHVPGAGCYGHNGADDAAFDAALIANLHPERPVRVVWSRADELTCGPLGSAMLVENAANLAPDGTITDWAIDVWSGHHSQRPGANEAANLLGATQLDPPWPLSAPQDLELANGGGGLRNAVAPYCVPRYRVAHHLVLDMPFRLSALRSLGAYANVFAIESFMDELADVADVDPIEFRLRHLTDPRARAVIEAVARASAWDPAADRATGHSTARGIGFSRYKNRGGYAAVMAEVAVEEEVRVLRVWCAVDVGLVVNPDGLRNQVEGGVIQSISWTLKEAVRFDDERIVSDSWAEYPILGFAEIPEVEVMLIGDAAEPHFGAGEVVTAPTVAAVANAVSRAIGVRVRDLPLTRDRLLETLSAEAV